MKLATPGLVAAAVGGVVYLGAELLVGGKIGPSLDDGWIYMAFARGFVEGDAFSYAGHDGPVASVTGPIWCMLLGLAMAVFGAGVTALKVLGAASALFAAYGTTRLGLAATRQPALAAVAGVIVGLTPRVLWGALSGMEASFAAGAVALGMALHLERRTGTFGRWLPALLALALGGWGRPEVFVFLPLAALHRRRVDGALAVAVLLAAYPAFHLAIYGYPLPLPFYAKAAAGSPLAVLRHDGVGAAVLAAAENIGLQVASLVAWLPSFLPFLVPGFLVGVRRGMRSRDGVPFLALALLVFAVARGGLGFQPPSFQQGRYFTSLWPLFLVVALSGFDLRRSEWRASMLVLAAVAVGAVLEPKIASVLFFDWIPQRFDVGTGRATAGLLTVPAIVWLVFALAGMRRARGDDTLPRPPALVLAAWMLVALFAGAHRHGQGVRDTYELNVAMAEEAARLVPEGEGLACHDLGAIAWFVRRPILDLAGLGTPEIARAPRAPGTRPDIAAILNERRPRFVCLTEDMADMVNPGGNSLRGVVGIAPLATIRSEHNVTVQGNVYHLLRIDWAP
jgi:hypothetical protein